ncbi:MAG: 2,4'-dihydroxyacetophenone dioxygenase family protein [Robiginitomaculum sp.]|nr:2,4'-dihydroxyacetophenone dioxygenase family protein [Robiginitomaculum sp.]
MSTTQMKSTDKTSVQTIQEDESAFFDTTRLKWIPWVMEGTWFKLLKVDTKTGGWTMMLKVDPDNDAPVHGHVGAIEGIILEGEFGYGDDRGSALHFTWEPAGAVHKPDSPNGFTMFAITHGPLVGYNDDGTIAAVIDGKLMYEMAKAEGAADHVDAKFPGVD